MSLYKDKSEKDGKRNGISENKIKRNGKGNRGNEFTKA